MDLFAVKLNCGDMSAENLTYFESTGSETGTCSVKICPVSDNICCGLYPISGRDDSCVVVINVAINLEISDHVKND